MSGPKCGRCGGLLVARGAAGKTIERWDHVVPCTNPETGWIEVHTEEVGPS